MDRSEGNTSITPPVTFTPMALLAGPFEACGSNGCLEASITDCFITFGDKVHNILFAGFSINTRSTFNHPFGLIEHLNGVDLVLVLLK